LVGCIIFVRTTMTAVEKFGPPENFKEVITPKERVIILDASELYRPENRDAAQFRVYDKDQVESNPIMKRVYNTYLDMHTSQTCEFVQKMREKWLKFNHGQWTIMEALHFLNRLVDESDPDVDIPNIVHAFQTAERIRQMHPDEDWFHLTGLVHDLGKVMALCGEPQWAVVGDTWPMGCEPAKSIVFRDTSFEMNADAKNPKYNSQYGVYKPNCGLDQLMMSWGHDEYLYRVLRNHPTCTLPDEALYMIRFHSFYPWHTGGDYWHLTNEKDKHMYYWIREFNKFDLYSKSDNAPNLEELTPYYQSLIDKYIPGVVKF